MKKVLFLIGLVLITACNNDDKIEKDNKQSAKSETTHFCSTDDSTLKSDLNGRVSYKGHYWVTGQNISIKFLNGDAYVQNKVKQIANQWTSYANIKFVWVESNQPADINVAFNWKGDTSSWSIIGKYAVNVAQDEPTMNYGSLDKNTDDMVYYHLVLHEFGHALGLAHEHLNPAVNIQWNKPVVYAEYAKSGWDAAKVDFNILNPVPVSQADYTFFDENSIMLYSFPASFTLNNYSTAYKIILSDEDKTSIGTIYPFSSGSVRPALLDKSTLNKNESILVNTALISKNDRYWLYMHDQGNLVVYDVKDGVSKIIWDANTYGNPGAIATMQADGNFIINKDGKILWSTKTSGNAGSKLTMQDDGNVVLSLNGSILWKSK